MDVERCCTHRSFGGDGQSRRTDEQQQLEETKHREKRVRVRWERERVDHLELLTSSEGARRSQHRSVGAGTASLHARLRPVLPSDGVQIDGARAMFVQERLRRGKLVLWRGDLNIQPREQQALGKGRVASEN